MASSWQRLTVSRAWCRATFSRKPPTSTEPAVRLLKVSLLVPCICSFNGKDFTKTRSRCQDHTSPRRKDFSSRVGSWNPWHVLFLPILYLQVRLESQAHFISSDPLPTSPIGTPGTYDFIQFFAPEPYWYLWHVRTISFDPLPPSRIGTPGTYNFFQYLNFGVLYLRSTTKKEIHMSETFR